jgi:hypothetical protein
MPEIVITDPVLPATQANAGTPVLEVSDDGSMTIR